MSELVEVPAWVVMAFEAIIANDDTYYSHHQARRSDRKRPSDLPGGGSIFLTPREIAHHALKQLVGAGERP